MDWNKSREKLSETSTNLEDLAEVSNIKQRFELQDCHNYIEKTHNYKKYKNSKVIIWNKILLYKNVD